MRRTFPTFLAVPAVVLFAAASLSLAGSVAHAESLAAPVGASGSTASSSVPIHVTPFVEKVQASALHAAEKRAGTIRTSKVKHGGVFKASSSKDWSVRFRTGAPGYVMQSGQSWSKAAAYRRAVIAAFLSNGLTFTGSSNVVYEHRYLRSYANSRYVCSIYYNTKSAKTTPGNRFVCVTTARHTQLVTKVAPFVVAFTDPEGSQESSEAYGNPTITAGTSPTFAEYQRATSTVTGVYPGSSAMHLVFARPPEGAWSYLGFDRGAQTYCWTYEANSVGSRAWAGAPCVRNVDGHEVESTVVPE